MPTYKVGRKLIHTHTHTTMPTYKVGRKLLEQLPYTVKKLGENGRSLFVLAAAVTAAVRELVPETHP